MAKQAECVPCEARMTKQIEGMEQRLTHRIGCLEKKLLGNGNPLGLVTRVALVEQNCTRVCNNQRSTKRRSWEVMKLLITAILGGSAGVKMVSWLQ